MVSFAALDNLAIHGQISGKAVYSSVGNVNGSLSSDVGEQNRQIDCAGHVCGGLHVCAYSQLGSKKGCDFWSHKHIVFVRGYVTKENFFGVNNAKIQRSMCSIRMYMQWIIHMQQQYMCNLSLHPL